MIKTFVIFAIFISLGKIIPDEWMEYFYLPSAWLTSFYMGIPLTHDAVRHCFKIDHPLYPIEIIRVCSGFHFFCMISALLLSMRNSWNWKYILELLTFAWGITIVANAFRMICAQSARAWSTPWIGDHWQGAIHESVGSLVFILFGVLAYLWKSKELQPHFIPFINPTRKTL